MQREMFLTVEVAVKAITTTARECAPVRRLAVATDYSYLARSSRKLGWVNSASYLQLGTTSQW